MKSSLLSFALVMLTGMLIAAETNLYINPKYTVNRKLTERKKKLFIDNHWYEGEISLDGDYKGAPAVKIKSIKVSWGGYNGVIGSSPDSKMNLKPGKYTFSVWCKLEGKPTSVYIYRSSLPDGQKKPVRKNKSYKGGDLPAPGKWTELVMDFEVKPGDTRNSFGCAVYSTTSLGPQVIWFADPKITPEEE